MDKLKKLHGEEDEVEQESEDDEDDFHEEGEVVKKVSKKAGRQGVSAEVYGDWNKKDNFVPPVIHKSEETKHKIKERLSHSFLF